MTVKGYRVLFHSLTNIYPFFFFLFPDRNDTGVFVSDIVKGGLVDVDGRLMQGDQILSVNSEDIRSATQEAVAALLKVTELTLLIYMRLKFKK